MCVNLKEHSGSLRSGTQWHPSEPGSKIYTHTIKCQFLCLNWMDLQVKFCIYCHWYLLINNIICVKRWYIKTNLVHGSGSFPSLTPGANVCWSILFPLTEACHLFQKLPNCVNLRQKKTVGEGLLDSMIYFYFIYVLTCESFWIEGVHEDLWCCRIVAFTVT